jgi:hypothetical protein
MKASRDMLEDRLQNYEESLAGLTSFVNELKTMTDKYGTDQEQFEEDLIEAKHNIKFYELQIQTIKQELGGPAASGPARPAGGTKPPSVAKPGISSFIFSSIGFIAGALFGSRLKARKDGVDAD